MQAELFPVAPVPVVEAASPSVGELSQWFTPAWFAEILYDAHFGHLSERDLLWEPAAGTGACLAAVPAHVPAFGTEIDPRLARIARQRTGRRVIVGDFCSVPLPDGITAVFGNPPFDLGLVERLLERCASIMPEGSRCGLILPAYFFQTSSTVVRLNQRWTLQQEMIPRDLFNRPQQLQKSLIFGLFTRDNAPRLVGLRGYHETEAIRALDDERQRLLDESFRGPRSVWREVLTSVLAELGGEAALSAIYRRVEGRRPTPNTHWKEQIRKVAQSDHFIRVAEGVYALPERAAA
jgi:site-specific DNA-methyltransferase (adenine-specific)